MARKSKFGGKDYAPQSPGVEPAAVVDSTKPATPRKARLLAPTPPPASSTRGVMVQFSSRCELDAERQFKGMATELGKKQQALLAEALNLLFKKYGKGEVA